MMPSKPPLPVFAGEGGFDGIMGGLRSAHQKRADSSSPHPALSPRGEGTIRPYLARQSYLMNQARCSLTPTRFAPGGGLARIWDSSKAQRTDGRVWFKAAVLKTAVGVTLPGVRIPLRPLWWSSHSLTCPRTPAPPHSGTTVTVFPTAEFGIRQRNFIGATPVLRNWCTSSGFTKTTSPALSG